MVKKRKDEPKKDLIPLDVTDLVNPLNEDVNDVTDVVLTPAQKAKEMLQADRALESLAEKQQVLQELRDNFTIDSRLNDIVFIKKIDSITDEMLNTLYLQMNNLNAAMSTALEKGDTKAVMDFSKALGTLIEKRNELMGVFDNGHNPKSKDKRNIKLALKFTGSDGTTTQAGVEVSDE